MNGIFKTRTGARIRALIVTVILAVVTVMCVNQNASGLAEAFSRAGEDRTNLIIALLLAAAAGIFCLLKKPGGKAGIAVGIIWLAAEPLFLVWLLQNFTLDPMRIYPSMLGVNWLFILLFELALVFASGSAAIGCTICGAVVLVIGITNYFVVSFRGTPIVPWDIYSLRTAASVAGNYSYTFNWKFVFSVIGFSFVILAAMKDPLRIRKAPVRVTGAVLAAAALAAAGWFLQKEEIQDKLGMDTILFTPNVRYRNNGFLAAYIGDIHLITVKEPPEYSVEKTKDIVDRVTGKREEKQIGESTRADVDMKDAPNIIVIMNEAFSDLSVLGDFSTNIDYMPNMRSMMEEYAGGKLMVSVKGGNTANTEYEFLSGDSMAFLPEGSVVYQQFIHDNVPAIPSYLAGLGYDTIAIHPYNASGWERDKVYNLLGFREFLSLKDFVSPGRIRDYVSDEAAFGKIREILQENEGDDGRDFIFEVTMQNHGGYSRSYADFSPSVKLEGLTYSNTQTKAVESYLSLIRESDIALKDLTDWLQGYEEPVILVMFGDHQPSEYITNVIERMTGHNSETSLEAAQQLYIVPCLVWNNYGADIEINDLLSVNYLAADILSGAGLPLTQYQRYLMVQQQELPAVSAGAFVDKSGQYHSLDQPGAYSQILNDYNILEYNHLIDINNRVTGIFSESLE